MDTYSETYRHQCEVRTCIRISIENGKDVLRAHLDGCEQKRGKEAVEKLKTDISTQWKLGNKGESGEWREPEWER
jgi:hypothetical protein